jgi:hypothetical protein
MNSKIPSEQSLAELTKLGLKAGLSADQLARLLTARPEVHVPAKLVQRILVLLRDGPKKRGRPRRNAAATDFILGDIADIYHEALARIQAADKAAGKQRGRETAAVRAARETLAIAGKRLPTVATPEALLNLLSEHGWLGRPRGRRRAPVQYPED